MENKGIKRSYNYLSDFETAYNKLQNTPYFNQTDWDLLSKRSTDDLSAYINLVSQYDKLPNYDEVNEKYFLDDMDVDQKSMFMYSQLYADDKEVKDWPIVTGYDDAGKEIKQKFQMTEKQYYDKLFNDWADYAKEQKLLQEQAENKANADFWGHVELTLGSIAASAMEFTYGVVEMGNNLINFTDAFLRSTWDSWAFIGTDDMLKVGFDKFREYMSDDKLIGELRVGNLEDTYAAILEWEKTNTYYMDVYGNRTTAGKIFGDTARSIGPIVVTMAATYALGPAGAGLSAVTAGGLANALYYSSSLSGSMRDRFRDPKFNSTPTETIILETGLRTATDYAIEKAFGKMFGATQMDIMRGLTATGKKATGFGRYLLDALQEGLEESVQEFSGWAVENFVGLFRDEYRSDLTMSQLVDAAIGGIVSSLVLGGFGEIRNAAYDNKLSKSLVAFDRNYYELGIDSDKETRDQKTYRENLLEFRRAQQQIAEVDTDVKTINNDLQSVAEVATRFGGTGKIVYDGSKGYGLTAINNTYKEIADDIDTSTPEGQKLLAQLNLQLYTSYKVIMDMYGEFGAERTAAAEKLLNDMNVYADKKISKQVNYDKVTAESSKSFAESLSNQLGTLLKDKTNFDAEKIKKLEEATKKAAEKVETTTGKKRGRPKKSDESKSTKTTSTTEVKFTEKETSPIKGRKNTEDKNVNITDDLKNEIKNEIDKLLNDTSVENTKRDDSSANMRRRNRLSVAVTDEDKRAIEFVHTVEATENTTYSAAEKRDAENMYNWQMAKRAVSRYASEVRRKTKHTVSIDNNIYVDSIDKSVIIDKIKNDKSYEKLSIQDAKRKYAIEQANGKFLTFEDTLLLTKAEIITGRFNKERNGSYIYYSERVKKIDETYANTHKDNRVVYCCSTGDDFIEGFDVVAVNADDLTSDDIIAKAKEIKRKYDGDFVIMDVDEVQYVDGILFIDPKSSLVLDTDDIVKTAVENELIEAVEISLPDDFKSEIAKMYENFINGYCIDMKHVIANMLFNKRFYNFALNSSNNYRIFNILKVLDNFSATISDKLGRREQLFEAVKRVKTTIGPVLAWYCCTHVDVNLENVTVFTKEQLAYIREHRINYQQVKPVLTGDTRNANYDKIKNRLINTVKTSTNITEEQRIIYLNRLYKGTFNGQDYEELYLRESRLWRKNKLHREDYSHAIFNTMLDELKIDLNTVFGYYIDSDENALNNLKNCFESYTNNTWTFDVGIDGNRTFTLTFSAIGMENVERISSGKLEIIDENYNTYNVEIYDIYNPYLMEIGKPVSNYNLDAKIGFNDNTSVVKSLSPILKTLDDLTYTYLSVKDIILNPVKYLKQHSINAIVNDTGSLTSLNVLSYLNDFLHSKGYHISMKTTGDVAVLKLNSVEETFGRDTFELSQYFVDLITEYSNKPYNRNKNNEYVIIDGTSGEVTEYPNIQFSRKLQDIINLNNVYEKYIDDLLNINVKFMCINLPNYMGSYNTRNNEITVCLDNHYNTLDLIDTIWHELVHAIQQYNKLSQGFTTNAELDDNVIRDYLLHSGGDETLKALAKSKNIGRIIVRRMYEASFGENEARGGASMYAPFIMHNDLIITPWGSVYVYNFDKRQYELLTDAPPAAMPAASRLSLKTVLNTSTETDSDVNVVQQAKKKVPKYEEYVKYKNAVDKALDIVKVNIKNDIKTTSKDLAGLGLPADIKNKIIHGEYTKSTDTMYQDAASEISRVKRKGIRKSRIQQKQENKYKGKGTRLFKKNVEGTNLMNWVEKNPEGAPYLSEAAQKFVIEADDLSKLPDVLRKAITNATLTDAIIYDFVRDAYNEGMDQYVFDALKKSYFRRTPFETFDQVVEFTQSNIVVNGYALQAAFKSVGLDDYITEILSKDPEKFKAKLQVLPKLFEQGLKSTDEYKRKKYEKMLNTYTDVLDRFESTVFKKSKTTKESDLDKDNKDKDNKDKKEKGKKDDKTVAVSISTITKTFDIADAHQDILLGLLNYFRGTISDVAYVAGNAKKALSRELLYNAPFTYKGRKDVAKRKDTVRLDAQVGGKKGDDKSRSLEEIVAAEVKQVQLQSSEDDLSEIKRNIEQIVHDELLKQINIAKKKGKSINEISIQKTAAGIHNKVRNYDYDEAVYRLALLNTRYLTKYTTAECLGIEKVDIKSTEIKESSEQKDAFKKQEKAAYNQVLDKVRSSINRLTDKIPLDDYKRIPEDIKKYIVKDGKTMKYNTAELRKLSKDDLEKLNDKLLEYKTAIKTKEFATQSTAIKRMEKTIAKKDKEIERLKKKLDKKVEPKIYTADLHDGITVESAKPLSDKLKPLLKATFAAERKSKMQFYAAETESNFVVSAKDFYDINADTLDRMNYDDAVEIVNYFETAVSSNDDYTPYKSFQLFTMAWILEQINDGNWTDPEYLKERIEKRITAIVQTASRVLGNWRGLIKKVKPKERVMMAMAASFNIDLTEEEIAPLMKSLEQIRVWSQEGSNPETFKKAIQRLQQTAKNLERTVVEKARKKNKDGKLTKLDYIKWFNRILKFQKAAMLSAPATITRNWLSNVIINGFDVKDKHVWGMNDLSDWIGGFFSKSKKGEERTPENQYHFKGVKVSTEKMMFIKDKVLDSGLLDLVSDGLTKYDSRKVDVNTTKVEDQLTDMIAKSVASRVINEHTYGKGKFTKWLEDKTDKTYEHGVLDNIVNTVFKLQSDNKQIQKQTLRYLGKMLEINKVDVSQGLTAEVMATIADAYTMAAWDLMHRANFFSDIENTFQKKWPSAHFVYKLILPFTSSSWNWFLDSLQMNPIALFNNIRKLNNLEKVISTMEDRRQRGDTSMPDSRFAEMMIRRNIGKGVLGTLLWMLGAGLAAWGKLQVDEEDEKMKLRINDTWFDISNVYGTSSLLIGAAFVSTNEEGSWFTVVESALNQQFDNSILTTVMNAFRYNDTPADYLLSLPKTLVSGFIPNVWKQAVNLTKNKQVKYSSNRILGDLQYLAMQSIPFFENVMEPAIDPYTGEEEMRYSIPVIHQLITLAGSPVSIKTYDISDIEAICRANGVSKQMLKGDYDDIGKVDRTVLNKFYGELNGKRIEEFVNGRTKYSVEIRDGVYKELTYKQMNAEQRKSVLNRITTQNANYAKIYVWTTSGHKYYCNSDKRNELMQLGITKNVYVGKEKFVK